MASEMERRKFVFDITVRHWQRGLLANVFRSWVQFVAVRRQRMSKFSIMFKRFWGGDKEKLAAMFKNWREWVNKRQRLRMKKEMRKAA